MLHVIWEFRVKPDKSAEFECEYSSTGVWARFFGKSLNYKETILLRDSGSANRYVVIDVWQSASSYEQFKKQYAEEYAAIDRNCERLTETETRIGVFETV